MVSVDYPYLCGTIDKYISAIEQEVEDFTLQVIIEQNPMLDRVNHVPDEVKLFAHSEAYFLSDSLSSYFEDLRSEIDNLRGQAEKQLREMADTIEELQSENQQLSSELERY